MSTSTGADGVSVCVCVLGGGGGGEEKESVENETGNFISTAKFQGHEWCVGQASEPLQKEVTQTKQACHTN